MLEDLLSVQRQIVDVPRAILTHPTVPRGRAFRQWDTRGRLWLWVHPDVLARLPRGKPDPLRASFGIPIRRG